MTQSGVCCADLPWALLSRPVEAEKPFIRVPIRSGEAAENHVSDRSRRLQKLQHALHRDLGGLIRRKTIDTRRDAREGDALQARFGGEAQGVRVAGTELLHLAIFAAVPNRADGVDDVSYFEPVALSHLRLAGAAAMEHATLRQQRRPCGTMDRAIPPPPPSSEELAALTMASTSSVVMSAWMDWRLGFIRMGPQREIMKTQEGPNSGLLRLSMLLRCMGLGAGESDAARRHMLDEPDAVRTAVKDMAVAIASGRQGW